MSLKKRNRSWNLASSCEIWPWLGIILLITDSMVMAYKSIIFSLITVSLDDIDYLLPEVEVGPHEVHSV